MLPVAESADIALLLEGTYPFVQGGVSSWVHNLIQGFPQYRFAAVFLGSEPGAYKGIRYALPANLVHLEVHYLQGKQRKAAVGTTAGNAAVFKDVKAMHEAFLSPGNPHPEGCPVGGEAFAASVDHLMHDRLKEEHFLDSREAWEMITSLYRERSTDPSFIDYFWTVRSMHEPIWTLARVARNLIPARCYHSVSTGYAGFLGSLLAQSRKRPFILSEHGLYTKERKIDLFHSPWIKNSGGPLDGGSEGNYIRKLWIRFFEVLGRTAYSAADPIVSLYEGIRSQQIDDGAPAQRTLCIPNGIKLERYVPLRAKQSVSPKPVFALIGRIVPIKDVKTFIRAMRTVKNRVPGAEGWLVGPGDEDPRYFEECKSLAEALGLGDSIRFLGFQNVAEILPQVAILVLSSISEALPLTLLEGFAAGVPAVATDVGSCRQLIAGKDGDAEDIGLGRAGRVVDIGDPVSLAGAIVGLYSDPAEWERARAAGMARVDRYYTEKRMLDSYGDIYRRVMGAE